MNAASEYRQRAVEGASPVGLVVLLYGGAVTALLRASAAIDANDIEKRVKELNKVLAIIGQLQGTLDFEKGGSVAKTLNKFYEVMRAQVMEASIKNSKAVTEELIKNMTSLKEAWQQVERETTSTGITGAGVMGTAIPQSSFTSSAAAL